MKYNILDYFQTTVNNSGNKIAIIEGENKITFNDLNIKSTIKIKKSEIKSMVAEFYKKILWNYYNCKSPVTKNLIVRIFMNKPSEIFNLNNLKVLKDSIFFNGIN